MSEEKSLTKPIKAIVPRQVGIHKKLADAALSGVTTNDPLALPERIALVFDDSSSMSGQAVEDAKLATDEFIKSCNMRTTALAIKPLNQIKCPLTTNYPLLGMEVSTFRAAGSTPTWDNLQSIITDIAEESITRVVLFSDGEPTDGSSERYPGYGGQLNPATIIANYVEKKVPIDTVFIGAEGTKGFTCMKNIAEDTGGIFIHFKDSSSLRKGLKYLAPGLRGMLMNAEVKERLQKGELK